MYTFRMDIDWKHTREMHRTAQEIRRELPPQNGFEEVFALPRSAIGTVLIYGGAAIADIACAIKNQVRDKQ